MKNLSLNFQQRLGISGFLLQAQGPLGKISALGRIFSKVSFSDAEMGQVKQTQLGGGLVGYDPPTPEFGACKVQIDDADAECLRTEIDSRQTLHVADVAWITSVRDQLAKASEKSGVTG